ncbi:MAG: metallophosphoesterase [Janthinobacterium lividum]
MPVVESLPEQLPPINETRRSFLIGAAAAAAGLGIYAATHARHEIEIVRRTFPIVNLPDPFVGMRIAQISDIHLEEFTEPSFLRQVVQQVNALEPDLVLFTGDLISRGPAPRSVALRAAGLGAEVLSELKAPQRLAILGNHDVGVNADWVVRELETHGTPVLVDSFLPLEQKMERLFICGSDDAGTRTPDPFLAIPADPRAPVIFLVHEPDYIEIFQNHPRFPLVDIMLSGHSHGGQIRLPLVGPLVLPPMGKLYPEGLYRFDKLQLYVNRGIGTVGVPFRLNCPAEITQITLQRA